MFWQILNPSHALCFFNSMYFTRKYIFSHVFLRSRDGCNCGKTDRGCGGGGGRKQTKLQVVVSSYSIRRLPRCGCWSILTVFYFGFPNIPTMCYCGFHNAQVKIAYFEPLPCLPCFITITFCFICHSSNKSSLRYSVLVCTGGPSK